MPLIVFIYSEEGSENPSALLGRPDDTIKQFADEFGCEENAVLELIKIDGSGADMLAELGRYDREEMGRAIADLALAAYLAGQKSKAPA